MVKLNHEEIDIALEQASLQLGGNWRLPTLEGTGEPCMPKLRTPKNKKEIFS